jgi:hypothetical protein
VAHRSGPSPDDAERSRATSSQPTFPDASLKRLIPTSRMALSGTTDRGV